MMKFLRFLGGMFFRNLGLKFIALALAIIVFLIAREETFREVDIDLPVVTSEVPAGKILVSEVPQSLKLRVRASIHELSQMLESRKPYELDLKKVPESQTIILRPEDFQQHLGDKITVLAISPGKLDIDYDEVKTRELRVNVQMEQAPAEYWKLDEPLRANPSVVSVTAPGRELAELRSISTAPIDLSEMKEDAELVTELEIPRGVRVVPETVTVQVKVRPETGSKTLRWVAPKVTHCPVGYRCTVSPATFTVKLGGLTEQLVRLDEQTLSDFLILDLAQAGVAAVPKESRVMLQVKPRPLQGVRFEFPDGAFFSVTFEKKI